MNLVVLAGRLAAPAERRQFASGAEYLRFLVTVRASEPRRRVDVIPVTLWDPPSDLVDECGAPGIGVWVVGTLQRRFWAQSDGRRSRLELIARHVETRSGDGATETTTEEGSASDA